MTQFEEEYSKRFTDQQSAEGIDTDGLWANIEEVLPVDNGSAGFFSARHLAIVGLALVTVLGTVYYFSNTDMFSDVSENGIDEQITNEQVEEINNSSADRISEFGEEDALSRAHVTTENTELEIEFDEHSEQSSVNAMDGSGEGDGSASDSQSSSASQSDSPKHVGSLDHNSDQDSQKASLAARASDRAAVHSFSEGREKEKNKDTSANKDAREADEQEAARKSKVPGQPLAVSSGQSTRGEEQSVKDVNRPQTNHPNELEIGSVTPPNQSVPSIAHKKSTQEETSLQDDQASGMPQSSNSSTAKSNDFSEHTADDVTRSQSLTPMTLLGIEFQSNTQSSPLGAKRLMPEPRDFGVKSSWGPDELVVFAGLNRVDTDLDSDESFADSFGQSAGVRGTWVDNNRLRFSLGLDYNRLHTTLNFNDSKTVVVTQDNRPISLSTDSAGNVMPVFGSQEYSAIQTRRVYHNNHFELITIPIEIGMQRSKKRLVYGLDVGAAYSFVLSQRGRILDTEGRLVDFDSSSQRLPLADNAVSIQASPFFGVAMTPSTAIRVAPIASYILTGESPLFDSKGLSAMYTLRLGLVVNLD